VQAVLQAGGRGERLRPLTDTTPKPLVPVAGMPMIERLVRQLADSGVRTITVITAWLGHRIEEHLGAVTGLPPELQMSFLRERSPLGTLGALGSIEPRHVRTLFLFADLVTDLDFRQLFAVHLDRGADMTLASHLEGHRLRLGEIESKGDRVTAYSEKPEKLYTICSGIAVFDSSLARLIEGPAGFSEFVTSAVEGGYHVTHWRHGASWLDVNSQDALTEATLRILAGEQHAAVPA
jgi:NDP-sugar pyrophosphorylase family protein